MRCACIDIGSNTTRVLVAEVSGGRVRPVVHHKAFTAIGSALRREGRLSPAKVDEVTDVVLRYRAVAEQLGARALRTVATAAIRDAADADVLVDALRARAGVEAHVLAPVDEARLAFLGARAAAGCGAEDVAVVDVGGGSSELAVGGADGMTWCASLPVGSGALTDLHVRRDPPARAEIAAMAAAVAAAFARVAPPAHARALAVGGGATSLNRLVGPVLAGAALHAGLRSVLAAPAAEVAARLGLEPERVRLLPAGILILDEAQRHLACAPIIVHGGLREGVCLELAGEAGGRS